MPFHRPKQHSLLASTHLVGTSRAQCYIVYEEEKNFWWQRYLKKGYSHAFIIIFDGYFWIKMEYSIGYMDIFVLPYYNENTIHDVLRGRDCTFQYVEAWRRTRYRTLLAPWTCIEAVKAVLGFRAWSVITPYQLYKHIEANNGQKKRQRSNGGSD